MTQDSGDLPALLRRLTGRRALARLAILFERVWPALWPPLGIAGLFVCAALLDIPRLLPPGLHLALLAATGLVVVGLLVRGLGGIAAPDDAAADRRLERASGLSHRPLAVLTDRPAHPDTAGLTLWQAHVARTVRQVRRLRVGAPHPGLPRRDRRALRGALVVALVAAFAIAGPDAPARLAYAMAPTLAHAPGPPTTALQAWITPPAYTQVAPLFLRTDGGALSVPAGSHLTVSVTGGSGKPVLSLDGHGTAFRVLDKGSFQADQELPRGGHLAVRRNGGELAGWDLTVVADRAPTVSWTEPPGRAKGSQQVRLPWQASDDYGVTSLQAELRLKVRPDAPPLIVGIPLPGGAPKAAHGVQQQDLTAHPWAGLPVIGRLVAKDATGQSGTSADADFVLPERPFFNPVARALIAIRKGLSLHPKDRDDAVDGLDKLLMAPKVFGADVGAYINLGALYYLLEYDKSDAAIGQAQQRLWELALHMEEGQTEQTARALDEARQAARDALDKAIRDPSEANRTELEKQLQALEQAIERHMQALLREAERKQQALPLDPNGRRFSDRDLQRLADQARQAVRQGHMADAQKRMAELERMLDQLRNARAQHGQMNQHQAEQRQRGREQMGALQDMIQRQGGLLDHSQGRTEQTKEYRANPRQTAPVDPDTEREADRRVQQALRRALGELMQQFGDLTGKVPQGLGDADQAMREAGRQLGQGNDKDASQAEQQAIEALQKGGQQMSQTMAQQFGSGQQGQEAEGQDGGEGQVGLGMQDGSGDGRGDGTLPGSRGRADNRDRDPFGRRFGQGSSGADESADVRIPEQRERQRTRTIEDELRRRGGERYRPQEELDYIQRLLKRF